MKNTSFLRRPFSPKVYNIAFILIGINIFIFLINSLFPQSRVYLAMNPGMVIKGGAVWQFLTYMFVHADITHILFNMLALFFFGVQVENRIGSTEFLVFYLVSGFLAGLFSFVFYVLTGMYFVLLLGASGAVFAVLLAFATFFPRALIYVMGIIPIRAPILVLIYTGIELFSQIMGTMGGVAHLTHLAGFVAGYMYLLARLRINPIRVFLEHR